MTPPNEPQPPGPPTPIRRRLHVRGLVQGVGFRPHVYRLAHTHRLAGFVANDASGAWIEIEGPAPTLDAFERDLRTQLPPLARITNVERESLPPRGDTAFVIRASEATGPRQPAVTPDAATCADCLRELHDAADRRHGYAFTNCTNCGPRYSILRTVPYDRVNTTMSAFTMCPACAAEYANPADRRFHAQPNACPDCGPQVRLELAAQPAHATARESAASSVAPAPEPIATAAGLLRGGAIVAIKGLGGFHLACSAANAAAVDRLRARKLRDGKPLAVMVPDVAAARRLGVLTPADEAALCSAAAPIVLVPQAPDHGLAAGVAPGCGDFGLFLPYAPLHHLLLAHVGGPLVLTSANLAGQPLTYRDEDARRELGDVADAFLTHDRPIFRPIDDSVVFTFRGATLPLRRARGYVPSPLRLAPLRRVAPTGSTSSESARPPEDDPPGNTRLAEDDASGDDAALPLDVPPLLAVGGDLKAAACLLRGGEALLSEHLGDLAHPAALRHYGDAVARLEVLWDFAPLVVAYDLHPRYFSTAYAHARGGRLVAVQHHHAHVAAVMAEHGRRGPLLGWACDGTGHGTDGATWGCELLLCERGDFRRVAHHAYFPLIGGERAALETWRPAAALLAAAYPDEWPELLRAVLGPAAPSTADLHVAGQQMRAGLNTPPTSSLGRVFDAASAVLGLCPRNRHEAEAAMSLEAAARGVIEAVEPLPYLLNCDGNDECRSGTGGGLDSRGAAGPGNSRGGNDGLGESCGCVVGLGDGCGGAARSDERRGGDTGSGANRGGDSPGDALTISFAPTIAALARERLAGGAVPVLAARFHETVARALAEAAQRAARRLGLGQLALSGGCFANRRLLARMCDLCEARGLRPLYNRHVPAGDGGLALGQAFVAAHQSARLANP